MNWITKALSFGEKIKKVLKKRPSKEDIANSDWTSCCKGPILKKDLEENLWVCNSCGKHHRINCRQRFDIIFGKNGYEIIDTPIPAEDPLDPCSTSQGFFVFPPNQTSPHAKAPSVNFAIRTAPASSSFFTTVPLLSIN